MVAARIKTEAEAFRLLRLSPRITSECGSAAPPSRVNALSKLPVPTQSRQYISGQIICAEGEPAAHLFNVMRGNVRLYKMLRDGRRQITGFLRTGDFFGYKLNKRYACAAEAVDAVELSSVSTCALDRTLANGPEVYDFLLELSRREIAAAHEQIILLGRKSTKEKLVSFLLQQLRRNAIDAMRKPLSVDLPMVRADIADYLGLSIETVSRTFTALTSEGLIHLPDANHVIVPDIDELEAAAEVAR